MPVYYCECRGPNDATYEREKALRFVSKEAAEQRWLDMHAFPEDYRKYLENGSTWAEQA